MTDLDPCLRPQAPSISDLGAPVLCVRGLDVTLHRNGIGVPALRGIDLELAPGEIMALVGESGSGKSTLGLAIQGLLPEESRPNVHGSLKIRGTEMIGAPERRQRQVRRDRIGAVFQDPMTSLNPTMRIGRQLAERLPDEDAVARSLDRVGIPQSRSRLHAFPHQLSGGQRQRVMIAMAMAGGPDLVIADEPTTALDVSVQAQILELIARLSQEDRIAFLFITHDLSVAASLADRIAVLYAGRLVEIGTTRAVLDRPSHPYTAALLSARFDFRVEKSRQLPTIPGEAPTPGQWPTGCPFVPRCTLASSACSTIAPALQPVQQHDGLAACIRTHDITPDLWQGTKRPWPRVVDHRSEAPLLTLSQIRKTFRVARRGLFGGSHTVQAIAGVDLEVASGEVVALVGESGSGKSTLARIAADLLRPDEGKVAYRGNSRPQMVYQDAAASLTPWLDVNELVGERLRARDLDRKARRQLVAQALERVGLQSQHIEAKPAQLSIGQCQRVAIARAIVAPPPLLICDEAVSAMDVSLAASILNLVGSLRRALNMAVLFITHDLAAARFIADRIVVLKDGRVIESGPADVVVSEPRQEYTRVLLASVPDAGGCRH